MNKPIWNTMVVDASLLKGYSKNPRDITQETQELLKGSLEKFGQVMPLVVNKDFTVLGGNQRLKLINGKVSILVPNRQLTETEEAEIVTLLNVKVGDWDWNKIEAMGIDTDVLVSEFNFDKEYVEKNSFDLDSFDFDEDFSPEFAEDENLIKQILVKFETIEQEELESLIKLQKQKAGVRSLEELVIHKARKYETNNS